MPKPKKRVNQDTTVPVVRADPRDIMAALLKTPPPLLSVWQIPANSRSQIAWVCQQDNYQKAGKTDPTQPVVFPG